MPRVVAVDKHDERTTESNGASCVGRQTVKCVGQRTTCVGRWPRRNPLRHHRRHQRPRLRCVATSSPPSCSPNSISTFGSGGNRVAGCVYSRIRVVRSRCVSRVRATDRGDVIHHVVDVDYFRSVSVHHVTDDVSNGDDSAANSSNTSSSSSDHDVSESVITSLPLHNRIGTVLVQVSFIMSCINPLNHKLLLQSPSEDKRRCVLTLCLNVELFVLN